MRVYTCADVCERPMFMSSIECIHRLSHPNVDFGFGFSDSDLNPWFPILGFGFRDFGLNLRFWVLGFGFWVLGFGFRGSIGTGRQSVALSTRVRSTRRDSSARWWRSNRPLTWRHLAQPKKNQRRRRRQKRSHSSSGLLLLPPPGLPPAARQLAPRRGSLPAWQRPMPACRLLPTVRSR